MKPHLDINHTGTLGDDDRVRMTFDPDSIAHLMSVLTDLYSDPAMAVIREYSTNAADAHRAAGNSDPIRVYSPTTLNPVFRVCDQGVGLSVEEITENFSRYGWSSKRDSDDEVGMLGLGCKSALSYTSQFTMIAVKDEKRAVVLVTRDSDGCGAVQIVDLEATDEPNGVEIQVPIKNPYSFGIKVDEFFKFWDEGSVLVDDESPAFMGTHADDSLLDPDVIISKRLDHDYVVMGGVPYPIDYDLPDNGGRGFNTKFRLVEDRRNGGRSHAMIRVPVGTVNFAPSREALTYTKRTIETITDGQTFINLVMRDRAQKEIDSCATYHEAWEKAEFWRSILGLQLRYNSETIPTSFAPPESCFSWKVGPSSQWDSEPVRTQQGYMTPKTMGQYDYIIIGFEKKAVSPTFREKLRVYWAQKSLQKARVLICSEPPGLPWTAGLVETIPAADVESIVITTPKAARSTPQHRIVRDAHGNLTDADLDPTAKLVWLKASDYEWLRGGAFNAVKVLDPATKYQVVVVHANRIDKFCRDNPAAVYAKSAVKDLLDKVTWHPYEMYALWRAKDHNDRSGNLMGSGVGTTRFVTTGGNWDVDAILDPDLKWCIAVASSPEYEKASVRWMELRNIADQWGLPVPKYNIPAIIDPIKAKFLLVSKRYGLLSNLGPRMSTDQALTDWLTYVNAVYLATTQLQLKLKG